MAMSARTMVMPAIAPGNVSDIVVVCDREAHLGMLPSCCWTSPGSH